MPEHTQSGSQTGTMVCPQCHQSVLPSYYFCPNCGKNLHEPPLPTDTFTQAWIYGFSIVLPVLCFLFISRWPGMKYYRSDDPKAKMIGQIAWILIIFSTLATMWYAYVWTENAINSSVASINSDMQ